MSPSLDCSPSLGLLCTTAHMGHGTGYMMDRHGTTSQFNAKNE